MWAVIKFDKKKLCELKNDLSRKLGSDPDIYIPKLNLQKFKNKKVYNLDNFLLGDYLLCYHNNFVLSNTIQSLKYCRGLKYFLPGFLSSQEEISKFINYCKNHEDDQGYLKQSFFNLNYKKNKTLKFISGPFNQVVFNLIQDGHNKFKVLINNLNVTVSKKKYHFFKPV